MPWISVQVKWDMKNALADIARANNQPRSDVIRLALYTYIKDTIGVEVELLPSNLPKQKLPRETTYWVYQVRRGRNAKTNFTVTINQYLTKEEAEEMCALLNKDVRDGVKFEVRETIRTLRSPAVSEGDK